GQRRVLLARVAADPHPPPRQARPCSGEAGITLPPMPRRFEFKRLFNIWVIFGLALLIRWCAAYLYYFVYKTPGGLPPDPTATEVYELLARELIEGRGLQSWLFAYRPPLEPMFI